MIFLNLVSHKRILTTLEVFGSKLEFCFYAKILHLHKYELFKNTYILINKSRYIRHISLLYTPEKYGRNHCIIQLLIYLKKKRDFIIQCFKQITHKLN